MAEENEQGTHLDVPDFLQYSHDHVWVDESVTPAVLGITEFAANKMGDIVFVDLPEVGMSKSSSMTTNRICCRPANTRNSLPSSSRIRVSQAYIRNNQRKMR